MYDAIEKKLGRSPEPGRRKVNCLDDFKESMESVTKLESTYYQMDDSRLNFK